MTHPTDEQLILYFYGETGDSRAIADHLAGCPACREDFALIQQTLNAVDGLPVPERGPEYGEQVWRRIAPQIRSRFRFWPAWLPPQRLAAAGAMACLLVVAFLLGRRPFQTPPDTTARVSPAIQSRLLLVDLADHIERSEIALVQLANSGENDLQPDRARAEDLLAENRLYRQTARMNGQPSVEDLLTDLEQILTEVSNAAPNELPQLKRRMVEQDILFKLRIVDSQLRERRIRTLAASSN
ncbi:MAG: hypothetical protein HXY18_17800 [Bryobacteraceae bacterium]|nr:hypothetical protein [Bryobacteraceae bacterium]